MFSPDSRPGIDETYEVAGNTSNLRVKADRRGDADVLIASGWSLSGIGMALLRLHSEWTSAQPRMFTAAHVIEHAATLPRNKHGGLNLRRAREELVDAYLAAVRELSARLPGRHAIEQQIAAWAIEKGINRTVVRQTLTHWLAPTCPVCLGRGKRKHQDAPVLAGECESCHGSGERQRPMGSELIYGYIDHALKTGRQSLKRRLRP